MIRRLLVGLLKGIIVGGAIGALLHFVLQTSHVDGAMNYLLYGLVALIAGVVAGQAPWKDGAWVASILKGIFGFGIGAGLYWLGQRFLGLDVSEIGRLVPALNLPAGETLPQVPLLFAPVVATVYGTLVELDDGGDQPTAAKDKTGVRVNAKGAPPGDADEVERDTKSAGAAKGKG